MNEQQQVEQAQAETATAAEAGTENLLRGLPRKPVPSPSYMTLQDAARGLLEAFGTPEMAGEMAPVDADVVSTIDPGLGRAVVAFSTFFDQAPQGKKYAFKVQDALADEDGMLGLADTLVRAAKDKALVAAAVAPAGEPAPGKGPPRKAAPPKAPEPPKKLDATALMGKE